MKPTRKAKKKDMSIKLFSLAKELNIGVSTLTGLLRSKGREVEENNPNVRIDNKDLDVILAEYEGKVSQEVLQRVRKKFIKEKKSTTKQVEEAPKEEPVQPKETEEAPKEEALVDPIAEIEKPELKILGKIDVDAAGTPEAKVVSADTQVVSANAKAHEEPKAVTTETNTKQPTDSKESTTEKEQTKVAKEAAKEEQKEAAAESKQAETKDQPLSNTSRQTSETSKASNAHSTSSTNQNKTTVPKESLHDGKSSSDRATASSDVSPQSTRSKAEPKQEEQKTTGSRSASSSSEAKDTPSQPKDTPSQGKGTSSQKESASRSSEVGTQSNDTKQAPSKEQKGGKKESNKTVQSATPSNKKDDDEEVEIFRINSSVPQNEIKVVGKIDLSAFDSGSRSRKKKDRTGDNKQRRRRVKQNAVDIKSEAAKVTDKQGGNRERRSSGSGSEQSNKHNDRRKSKGRNRSVPKVEVTDEDVQRQVKETLARLTNKKSSFGRAAKMRRDKRDAARQAAEEAHDRTLQEQQILKLTEYVTVSDLANMMDVPVNDVISTCMSIDMMVSINQRLDADTIKIVAEEFGFETEFVSANVVEAIEADAEEDNPEDLVPRVPIVTVMGHVDHGKTSLLDNIRKANVIAGEAGGITQHIGAYNVTLQNGRKITFLDTPGHEAFTAMRARGAQITDIAIIVIAADDQVMPQTVEAINHAAAAGVPMIFAINKIDKPGAQPEKIREQLAGMNYLVEEWGGKYQSQEIAAKHGTGVSELLEKVLLETDLLELKANPKRRAMGTVVESSLDKGRGYVSTLLVQNGTLRMGDIILSGQYFGRIKAMFNERNQRVEEAGISTPVLVLGFNGAPSAGDSFLVLETEQEAREIAIKREQLQREQGLRVKRMPTLDEIGRRIALGNFQELNLIIKGDVDGSVQALSDSLIRLSTPEVSVSVIHQGVGQISESDVVLAAASDAIILGFQVRPSQQARKNAENEGVEIRTYSIIYDAIEDLKAAVEGMMAPDIKENVTANVEVLQVFKIDKVGTIAGCMVQEGKIKATDKVRVIRDGIVIHSGALESLKRFKDDAKEVVAGLECGINIKNFNDLQEKDIIESYEEIEVRKKLS